jgi:hypothetical protein
VPTVALLPLAEATGGRACSASVKMPLSAGAQNLNLLNEDTGFALTTPEGAGAMRDHLGRLLYHTRLKAIQWINPNRCRAEFTTLSKTKL